MSNDETNRALLGVDRPQPQRPQEQRPLREGGYVEKHGLLVDAITAVPIAAVVPAVKATISKGPAKKDK
jgi:hypothetical protein